MPEKTEIERSDEDDGSFLKVAMTRYSRARERERENIEQAYEDLLFRAGENQWDEATRREREDEQRPVLVVNQVPQFVRQVTGTMRQMRPAVQVVAVDDNADPDTADQMSGLIRYIENRSDAKDAYFKGADSQVTCGTGHWRVLTEYAAESTFEQEIRIGAVEDGVSVLWDPDASLPTREDADWCFVPVDISLDAFKEKYPDSTASDFGDELWTWYSEWKTDSHVRIAEYWIKKPITRKLAKVQDVDGMHVIDLEDLDDDAREIIESDGTEVFERPGYIVERYLITSGEILEKPEAPFPSRFIPIVPVWGEEIRIGRRIVRHGVVRFLRDPQRIFNYNISCQTEVVALQPKAPWIGTEKNFTKHQQMWEHANRKAFPYLPYEPDSKNGNIAPQRVAPAVSSSGLNDGMALATDNMNRVTGIYPESLGEQGNATSGKAINARQTQGDTGTFVYLDNFTRAVNYTGRILVDMIPAIYDTERKVRILGEDGRVDTININEVQQGDGVEEPKVINDVTIGSYDVVTQTGPSFTTKREESREGMMAFVQSAPNVAPLILDLIAKAQDWPLSDQFAARIRATIPPEILKASEEEEGIGPDGEEGQPGGLQPELGPDGQPLGQEPQQPGPEEIEAAKMADLAADEVELSNIKVAKEKDLAESEVKQAAAQTQKAEADAEAAELNVEIKRLDLEAKRQQPEAV